MSQRIGFQHHSAGVSGLSVVVSPLAGGQPLNASGFSLTAESEAGFNPRFYQTADLGVTIPASVYRAEVLKGGAVLYTGLVRVRAAGVSVIDDETVQSLASLTTSALAQLTLQGPISVSLPTLDGQQLSVPLVRGDSYLAEHGRSIEFARADFPDLSGTESVTLSARHLEDAGIQFSLTGVIATASGIKVLRFATTSSQSSLWTPGKYEFDVQVEFGDGNVATFVGPNVFLRVIADVDE